MSPEPSATHASPLDQETIEWMLRQSDDELVKILFTAGQIGSEQYWRLLMPALRGRRTVSEKRVTCCGEWDTIGQRCDDCPSVPSAEREKAALHACEGLDTADLIGNKRGWLSEVVHGAARVEGELHRALRACCAGNTDDDDPVRCQSYEASEQGSPCPPGCCVMADEKDVRSILAAIELEDGSAQSATPVAISATQIHDVYQEEFYRKGKDGKSLAHSTHHELVKAVIHRLLGVEITEPWRGDPANSPDSTPREGQ